MNTFELKMYAADRIFYQGVCESLIVPTTEGLIGIWANHLNMIAVLIPGELTYRLPGEENQYAYVSGGIIKIENNEVLILVDQIEKPEEIDSIRAAQEADEAKEQLLQQKSRLEYYAAQAQFGQAINKLRVKKHRDINL